MKQESGLEKNNTAQIFCPKDGSTFYRIYLDKRPHAVYGWVYWNNSKIFGKYVNSWLKSSEKDSVGSKKYLIINLIVMHQGALKRHLNINSDWIILIFDAFVRSSEHRGRMWRHLPEMFRQGFSQVKKSLKYYYFY